MGGFMEILGLLVCLGSIIGFVIWIAWGTRRQACLSWVQLNKGTKSVIEMAPVGGPAAPHTLPEFGCEPRAVLWLRGLFFPAFFR